MDLLKSSGGSKLKVVETTFLEAGDVLQRETFTKGFTIKYSSSSNEEAKLEVLESPLYLKGKEVQQRIIRLQH